MKEQRRRRGEQMTEIGRLAAYFDLYDELGSGVLSAERCRAVPIRVCLSSIAARAMSPWLTTARLRGSSARRPV